MVLVAWFCLSVLCAVKLSFKWLILYILACLLKRRKQLLFMNDVHVRSQRDKNEKRSGSEWDTRKRKVNACRFSSLSALCLWHRSHLYVTKRRWGAAAAAATQTKRRGILVAIFEEINSPRRRLLTRQCGKLTREEFDWQLPALTQLVRKVHLKLW